MNPFANLPIAIATSMPAPMRPRVVGVKPSSIIGFFATPRVIRIT